MYFRAFAGGAFLYRMSILSLETLKLILTMRVLPLLLLVLLLMACSPRAERLPDHCG